MVGSIFLVNAAYHLAGYVQCRMTVKQRTAEVTAKNNVVTLIGIILLEVFGNTVVYLA